MSARTENKEFFSRVNAVCKKISYQFENSAIGRLAYSVVERAIHDACGNIRDGRKEFHQDSGLRYLQGDMLWCEMAGVESDWVRRVLKESGILEGKL